MTSLIRVLRPSGLLCLLLLIAIPVTSQVRGSMTVFGDVKVDESRAGGQKVGMLTVILCTQACATIVARSPVSPGGRYRFNNITPNEYDLVVEADGIEIARTHISVFCRPGGDFQQDLEVAWKAIIN